MQKPAMLWIAALFMGLLSFPVSLTQAKTITFPAGAREGLYANLWFEPYDGSEKPTFEPAPQLAPNTNYRLVVDLSTFSYGDTKIRRPGVISIPMPRIEPGQISQVVVEETINNFPQRSYFLLHRYRANVVRGAYIHDRPESGSTTARAEVDTDSFTLLKTSDGIPPWLVERHIFLVGVRDRLGEAPLAIVFRDPNINHKIHRVVSTRFCVALLSDQCVGLPRVSEYMENQIRSNPPPLPRPDEIRDWAPLKGNGTGGEERSWSWNSWVFRTGDANRTALPVLHLEEGGVKPEYTLQIDASLYIYETILQGFPVGHATPDPTLSKLIKKLLDQNQKSLTLTVRAEAIGHAVRITSRKTQSIVVDLTRLDPRNPRIDLSNTSTLAELTAKTAATRIELALDPRAVGCGAIAISITDKTGIRPLEQLVHSLEVTSSQDGTRRCKSGKISTVLTAGLHNLLTHGEAPPIDAALHVFEQFATDGELHTAAFLYGIGRETYSWEIHPPLSEFLADPKNLEGSINLARTRTKDEHIEHAYDIAATALANALFAGRDHVEQAKANAARAALQNFVNQASTPPTFLVRYTDRHGEIVFLPFGLLAAPGKKAFLDKPIQIILPLPKEDYAEVGCLGKWSLGISDALDEANVKVPIDVLQNKNWLGGSFENLRSYLNNQIPARNEGFVVVAHHDKGRMWYRKNDIELRVNELTRTYGPATVGVLAMCKAGGVSPVDRRVYEKLNNFGLDAVILSPFSLDANYGKVFAIEFFRVVQQATAAGRDDTLLNLFNKAVSAAAEAMRDHEIPEVKGSVGDMGLELILVGNHALRLCKNK